MATIALPDSKFASAQWSLVVPQQINRSEWTGRRQVMVLPGAAYWKVTAAHVVVISEANMLAWRSFFAQLKGSANTFRLPAGEADQHTGSEAAIQASAIAGAVTVALTGLAASVTLLKAGHFATVKLSGGGEQLVQLIADLTSDGSGAASLSFFPPLRAATTAGATLGTKRPTALVALDASTTSFAVDRGQTYTFSLAATEAF